jgi:hypothetical protein
MLEWVCWFSLYPLVFRNFLKVALTKGDLKHYTDDNGSQKKKTPAYAVMAYELQEN